MRVDEFNALPADDARALVAGWLGVRRWVDEVVAGRPYSDTAELRTRAHDSALDLTDDELASALSRHPRIGERPHAQRSGGPRTRGASRRASRPPTPNACAPPTRPTSSASATSSWSARPAGRSAEILAELRRRLSNDEETERAETVTALRDIALLRLDEVVR